MDAALDRFQTALLDLDRVAAERTLEQLDAGGLSVRALEGVVLPALVRIGEAWERGDVALSQVYMSGRLCEQLVRDRSSGGAPVREVQPRICVAVLDDSHILGKQIVVQMLRSAGYAVSDLGAGLGVDDVVDAVRQQDADVLVVSVLMLASALDVAELRRRLDESGRLGGTGRRVTIVVGGAPFRFDPELAAEVGADYVGSSASDIIPIMAQIEAQRS